MIKKTKRFLFPTEDEEELYLDDEIDDNDEEESLNFSNISNSFTPEYQQNSQIKEVKENLETKIFKPKGFSDAKEIMQFMIKSHSAIVDISDLLTSESGQREAEKIVCYLCGVSDAIGFDVKKINLSTFFFQSR